MHLEADACQVVCFAGPGPEADSCTNRRRKEPGTARKEEKAKALSLRVSLSVTYEVFANS